MNQQVEQLLDIIRRSQPWQQLKSGIEQNLSQQLVYGLTGTQQSYFLASIGQQQKRPLVIITQDEVTAKAIFQELVGWLPQEEIMFLPKKDLVQSLAADSGKHVMAERISIYTKLLAAARPILVTPIENLAKKVLKKEIFASGFSRISIGDVIVLSSLTENLVKQGYERVDLVEVPGQFSLRGGILDCFSLDQERPVRIEFFDEEVDSIRFFDVESQRSLEQTNSCTIAPALEYFLTDDRAHQTLSKRIGELFNQNLGELKKQRNKEIWESYGDNYNGLVDSLKQGIYHSKLEPGLGLLPQALHSLLDYFAEKPMLFVIEPSRCWEELEQYLTFCQETVWEMYHQGNSLASEDSTYYSAVELFSYLAEYQTIHLALMPRKGGKMKPNQTISFTGSLMYNFHGNFQLLEKEIEMYSQQDYHVAFSGLDKLEAGKLETFLRSTKASIPVYPIHLTKGFVIHEAKLALISSTDLFGQQQKRKMKKKTGDKIASFVELKPGDYVVHDSHGIGKYLGIEQLAVGEVIKDYLVIKYAGADKLYVPTDQLEHIQRYIGVEGQPPKVYKLGGNDWNRIKNRVKESVQELAKELLELYAQREATPGYRFNPDTGWQQEFEEKFPYVETEDQIRSIAQVKQDMEKGRPMDRLLCGDVGYGKTEVALRAAFKAVMDGKQVAVLVPTTILAQQHFETFSKRLESYPMTVEMLSRFRTPKQIKDIVSRIKTGEVDMIIGTHRLLSADIKFKDLGLLIVDEEQRFGVVHKEKLKRLKGNIDVLTLSATPIPRTLHMSMVGMRDLSVIDTPPEDRYPVQTYVVEENIHIIKEAILREMNRGGQVFYLYNRVADIEQVARKLQQLVPHARIGVTHGQMRENQLEDIMLQFIKGQMDVLVCTTIIENGLDIPNVNTIIVSQADKLGLSQLYQLRGRVGRSNRIAYAYFTYSKGKVLTEVAEKRLAAIKEFTHLGAGFKIAMRDLEIRGSGNILGPEQHGNMMSVGFDLYCRLLEQAVGQLKGTVTTKRELPAIELDVNAYFTDQYIPDNATKISIYKKLLAVETEEEVAEVLDEIIDRFGDLPPQAANLLEIARMRVQALQLDISKIKQEREQITISFNQDPQLTGEQLLKLTGGMGGKMSFNSSGPLEIRLKVTGTGEKERFQLINEIFGRFKTLVTLTEG